MEPINEVSFRELFAQRAGELGFTILLSQTRFPDWVVTYKCPVPFRAEAEFESINFLYHKHNVDQCDAIICWEHTPGISFPIPVYELKTEQWLAPFVGTPNATQRRELLRREKIRLAALKRHREARGTDGKSQLAVDAGRWSGIAREGDSSWGKEMALRRWGST